MVVKKICFPVLLLLLPIISVGQTYRTQNGHAEFTGHTPLFSFEGSSDSLSGSVNVADSTVQFRLPLRTLDTGNGKRNRDMMDVLEAEQYPQAKFEGKIITPVSSGSSNEQDVTVKGEFTVHGTRRILKISGTMQFRDNQLKILASWPLKLTDYNMDPPSISFYSMDNKIEIRIEGVLKPAVTSN